MSRTRIVIQSRLNSSRLPGKALLPIGGMPLIELVARRAARRGHEVVVATSTEPYDALIARRLAGAGIRVVRGSLDDVLGRFVAATDDLAPDDWVVRLTGDNPVADADLVQELFDAVLAGGHRYGRVDIDRAPEGLGAEVFTVSTLREAAARATAGYDREHVTPWIRREVGELLFVPRRCPPDPRRFRCTVDVLSDYERAVDLFESRSDVVDVPWWVLTEELGRQLEQAPGYLPVRNGGTPGPNALGQSALVLDGAGLGPLFTGERGGGGPDRVRSLLDAVVRAGFTHVMVGRDDGESERALRACSEPALRQRLRVISRVAELPEAASRDPLVAELAVESSLERSFAELGARRVDVVLLPSLRAALACDGAAWQRLQEYRQAGQAARIGVRLRRPDEVAGAAELPGLDYLELVWDLTLTDRSQAESLSTLARRGVVVTGTAVPGPSSRDGGVDRALERLLQDFGRQSVAELRLAHALGLEWLASVVVGADDPGEPARSIGWAARPALTADEIRSLQEAVSPQPVPAGRV